MSTIATLDSNESTCDARTRFDDAVSKCAHTLLRRVFRILRGCGFSENELREMAMRAVNEVERMPDSQRSMVTARQAMMCSDVVLRWRRDCGFVDGDGAPLALKRDSGAQSFANLVRACVPTANPSDLLGAMLELGVVRIASEDSVELISDSVVTCSGQDGLAVAGECVLEHICGFLGSVEFNVFDKPSRAKGRFERACYANVPQELVPVLQQLVRTRGQDFIDVIDEWLSRRVNHAPSTAKRALVGAGAYVFVREDFV